MDGAVVVVYGKFRFQSGYGDGFARIEVGLFAVCCVGWFCEMFMKGFV